MNGFTRCKSKWLISYGLFLIACIVTLQVFACSWDHDTLKMERSRFPNVLELITGYFNRHSTELYKWRIEDRLQKLKDEPDNLHYHDDLAVAYDKTGQHEKAIATMLKKEKITPGLYETKANLGTFYIHSGQLTRGLEHIERAIVINPDAHFGREVYQKHLVKYVLSKQQNGETTLPLNKTDNEYYHGTYGFAKYILKAEITIVPQIDIGLQIDYARDIELRKALKGVLGMMRFGKHNSPILLEALGDLMAGVKNEDAQRLTARAYLKASYETEDKTAQAAYRELAKIRLYSQVIEQNGHKLLKLKKVEELEKTLAKEIKKGGRWFK